MTASRLNFLCLSADSATVERCRGVALEFQYSFSSVGDPGDVLEMESKFHQAQFAVIGAGGGLKKEEIAQMVQIVKHVYTDCFICVVTDRKIPNDAIEFLKKSGANFVMLENEFHETSRLEFVASQVIRASYVPTKISEFAKDSVLDFTLFHLMPLNQKLLPILPKGTPLDEKRLKKLEIVGEVFVRRDEVDRYQHYVETHLGNSAKGLQGRCRAQYLSLCTSHTQLIFNLLDQSEGASFKEGKWLYDRCELLARDLLSTLASVGEAWDVVNNSSLGEFGSVERSPTIAAYSGLLSLMGAMGDAVEVMVAALLADIGMLELNPRISQKIRQTHGLENLTEAELKEYHQHPKISLNRCLDRKLAIKDSVRNIILSTHERVDGKGFPEGRDASEIPLDAMLIQFCEMIDRGAMVKMGQERTSIQEVRQTLVDQEIKDAKIFSYVFLQKIKPVI